MRGLLVLFTILCITNTARSQNVVQRSGDFGAILLPLSASILSLHKTPEALKQLAQSAALNYYTTVTLKYWVNKERPNGGRFSFPSGHTSSSFMAATFLMDQYGWKVGLPSYVLASYVGYTRIHAHKHDIWDVMAGAALGTVSSLLFSEQIKKRKISANWTPHLKSFSFSYQF